MGRGQRYLLVVVAGILSIVAVIVSVTFRQRPVPATGSMPVSAVRQTYPYSLVMTGQASFEVTPDVAVAELVVVGVGETADAARLDSEASFRRVSEALAGAGGGIGLPWTGELELVRREGPGAAAGPWEARRRIRVQVQPPARVAQAIDVATAAGAQYDGGLDFDLSQAARLRWRDRALAAAAAGARAEAEAVALALGLRLTGVSVVRDAQLTVATPGDLDREGGSPSPAAGGAGQAASSADLSLPPVRVEASVVVEFRI